MPPHEKVVSRRTCRKSTARRSWAAPRCSMSPPCRSTSSACPTERAGPRLRVADGRRPALPLQGMIAPIAVLTALVLLARRNFEKHHHEAEEGRGDGERPRHGHPRTRPARRPPRHRLVHLPAARHLHRRVVLMQRFIFGLGGDTNLSRRLSLGHLDRHRPDHRHRARLRRLRHGVPRLHPQPRRVSPARSRRR